MAQFLSLLPLVLQVLGIVLKWYNASDDTLQAYEALIKASSGLMPVQTRDKLLSQREVIAARIKGKREALKLKEPQP